MKTKAVRLHGVMDLRLDEFELPEIKDTEVLAEVISDSICMSSYKAASQGPNHKRVPDNVAENPVIIGHEFCGKLVKVGAKWADQFKEGEKFVIQPAINYKGSLDSPGYSYPYCGGAATYVILPEEVMLQNCLLHYDSDAYFYGSLAEPMSCIVGGYHANYHTKPGVYQHDMGVTEGGCMAILAGAGPMGLGCADYAIHGGRAPRLLIVTDIDDARLERASKLLTREDAARFGVDLHFVNTANIENPVEYLRSFTDGKGFNDVFVYAPVKPVVEMGDAILGRDGCLNFFAGPTDSQFKAPFNWYNVHYLYTHVVGTSGGNTEDMKEAIRMMNEGKLNPSALVTHIGGLNAVVDTVTNLPKIPGGKKLIYNHIDLPLAAIADFEELGKRDPMFAELDRLCKANNGLWNPEAEAYLLANAKKI